MNKLMSHMVAHYPTIDKSYKVAESLVKGGADILEIQFAFSDPSADGNAIQKACTTVLENGFKLKDGFAFIKKLHQLYPNVTIYIMSYGSLVYTPGVENFCKMAKDAGVKGLIIPDLPFDCDEGLTKACLSNGMTNIPVATPAMGQARLDKMLDAGYREIYVALRNGITGSKTEIGKEQLDFINYIKAKGAVVHGGFGIQGKEQADALSGKVDSIVAGSVFVNIITDNQDNVEVMSQKIVDKVHELKGN